METLNVAGLFAGIGGIELGLARAGHHAHLLCEIDPAARAVLRARFRGTRVSDDVRKLTSLPRQVDLLCAGFPCQDLSQAGKAKGLSGSRSRLVREVFRLLAKRRVPWVLLENVPFMLHVDGGRAIRHIVRKLEALGYSWAYRTLDARAFGLPQRRERVFLLASTIGDPRDVLLAADVGPPEANADDRDVACGFYWTEGNKGTGWAVDCTPTLKGGSAFGIPSPPAILLPSGLIVTPDIRDGERLQGFPSGWTKPCGTVRGRHRWRLVGNAVAVNVAEWLGRQLVAPGKYDARKATRVEKGQSWPRSAWSTGEGAHDAGLTSWPVRTLRLGLRDFLRYPGDALSRKAARGFLGRLDRSTLRVPPGLRQGLVAHIEALEQAECA